MQIENFYRKLGPVYNLIYSDWLFRKARSHAVELVMQSDPKSILEVGVGTGLTLQLYSPKAHVIGVDLSASMLAKCQELIAAKKLSHCEVMQMNATDLKFKDNHFDAVLGNLFLSATTDPHGAISEISRVCKPGGRIVFMNHFRSENSILGTMEDLIDPLTKKLTGFRSALELETITSHKNLKMVACDKVSPFGYWTTVAFENSKS